MLDAIHVESYVESMWFPFVPNGVYIWYPDKCWVQLHITSTLYVHVYSTLTVIWIASGIYMQCYLGVNKFGSAVCGDISALEYYGTDASEHLIKSNLPN
jgi:hypothetical protein